MISIICCERSIDKIKQIKSFAKYDLSKCSKSILPSDEKISIKTLSTIIDITENSILILHDINIDEFNRLNSIDEAIIIILKASDFEELISSEKIGASYGSKFYGFINFNVMKYFSYNV
jgi:hypothetical protein